MYKKLIISKNSEKYYKQILKIIINELTLSIHFHSLRTLKKRKLKAVAT